MTSRMLRSEVARKIFLLAFIAAVGNILIPNSAFASTDLSPQAIASVANKSDFVFEIKNIKIPDLISKNVPDQNTDVQDDSDKVAQNIAILQDYLQKKGSPLANYADTILQQENWKLVLAISNGESTLCKHQMYNNCWGVGGAWNLKRYKSFGEGFADVNRLLTDKYVSQLGNSPEKIVNRYVGHPNPNWVYAVNKILAEVNQLPLVN